MIIKLETNIPQTLALKCADGKQVEGNYGPQMMFSLVTGDIMYLPLPAAETIKDAGIRAGQKFTIVKKQSGKSTRYFVEGGNIPEIPKAQIPAPIRHLAQTAVVATSQPHEANQDWGWDEHGRQVPFTATGGNPSGVRYTEEPGPEVEHMAQRYRTKGCEDMMGSLQAAMQAAFSAEEFAARMGRPVKFTSEDLRSMAISLYIQSQKVGA